MKHSHKNHKAPAPPKSFLAALHQLRQQKRVSKDGRELSEASREVLRSYLSLVSSGATGLDSWLPAVREALNFLGGQGDRRIASLDEYDHRTFGPFLGISDEGSAAPSVHRAAVASPKVQALGSKASPLSAGVGLDAERLGSVGEVPVGPEEYAGVWSQCAGRLLMTTNVGSRANLRIFNRARLVVIPAGKNREDTVKAVETGLADAFKPYLEAPDGPRPITVFVEFEFGGKFAPAEQRTLLRSLLKYVQTSGKADPGVHQIGLNVRIGWGADGKKTAIRAIDLAHATGIKQVSIDGVVRKDADQAISLPGLLDYLAPDLATEVLQHAQSKGIKAGPVDVVDPDTVAREIWSGLNAARAMGFDLGKYGLFPLTLEEGDKVVEQIQRWFSDWCAAPVFYVDQGLVTNERVFAGSDTARGVEAWLTAMSKHRVKVVLIDTVDKSKGWKILKENNDPKGILDAAQIAGLHAFGAKLGIKTLWAGGITPAQAYEFGRLGVFGIYVTSAVSNAAPVTAAYANDNQLSAEKEPAFEKIVQVKTIIEAGFLVERLKKAPDIQAKIKAAGVDAAALSTVLPGAWRAFWKANGGK